MDIESVGASNLAILWSEAARRIALRVLMDGSARPAGELARLARVSPATMSRHLARLLNAGLLTEQRQGRHRYYKISNAATAAWVEQIDVGIKESTAKPITPNLSPAMRNARRCYDHLAGVMGVRWHHHLIVNRWLLLEEDAYVVGPQGEQGFASLGLDLAEIKTKHRRFACTCIDWSERMPHLSGALGHSCLTMFIARSWLLPAREPRTLLPSPEGWRAIAEGGVFQTDRKS